MSAVKGSLSAIASGVGGSVEGGASTSAASPPSWEAGMAKYMPLCKALTSGNWDRAKAFLDEHAVAPNAIISGNGETALHIAVEYGHVELVKELLKLITPSVEMDGMQRRLYHSGDTVLHIAARAENISIAKALVDTDERLVSVRNYKGQLPILLAAMVDNREMLKYLYSKTPADDYLRPEPLLEFEPAPQRLRMQSNKEKDCEESEESEPYLDSIFRPFKNFKTSVISSFSGSDESDDVFIETIKSENFGFALELCGNSPQLASAMYKEGKESLFALAEMPLIFSGSSRLIIWKRWIYNYMDMQSTSHGSMRSDEENLPKGSRIPQSSISVVLHLLSGLISNALKATDCGHEIYVMKNKHTQALELIGRMFSHDVTNFGSAIGGVYHEALFRAAKCGNAEFIEEILRFDHKFLAEQEYGSIFHVAVSFRQERVWNLLYALPDAKKNDLTSIMLESKYSLLHFAACPSTTVSSFPGTTMKLQRELQWYKEVESMVPSSHKYPENVDGKTPWSLFKLHHKEMVQQGEKWMRDAATSCTIVAILVATIMFAAAFTLPGGNDDSGNPIFINRNAFLLFITADAISLFLSVASVMMFLGVLKSRYAEDDFLKSLPKRMTIGLATLFLSLAAMMIAFGATLVLVMGKRITWTTVPVALLAAIPVTLFAFMEFPLFIDLLFFTYGPSIFNRKPNRFLLSN